MPSKWSNVLRGVAYGDAWGYRNEFRSYAQLTESGPMGPELPEKLIISDDTQMTLALARGLHDTKELTDDEVGVKIIDQWIKWFDDPDNNRAPGNTCMRAIGALKNDLPWPKATVLNSDGCGSVMRVSPAAFVTGDRSWQGVAAWQAASTHGRATGIAASLLTTAIIRKARSIYPGRLLEEAIYLASTGLHHDSSLLTDVDRWIDGHPVVAEVGVRRFMTRGLLFVQDRLLTADIALRQLRDAGADPWDLDPCEHAGPGWRAHDALACALFCIDLFPDDPIAALRRATVTSGDSDSIAAIAGSILGAMYDDPWPAEWFDRLETRYQKGISEAEGYEF